jgi:hypothetical protein
VKEMTIEKVQDQEPKAPEKAPVSVQNEIKKEVLKQTIEGDTQKELLQLLSAVQPQQQIQKTAQDQIEKGYLDIKV